MLFETLSCRCVGVGRGCGWILLRADLGGLVLVEGNILVVWDLRLGCNGDWVSHEREHQGLSLLNVEVFSVIEQGPFVEEMPSM